MCDCHPMSKEDTAIWALVKKQPRTREQWAALHDAIEQYRRLLIADYKSRDQPSLHVNEAL